MIDMALLGTILKLNDRRQIQADENLSVREILKLLMKKIGVQS